MFLRYNYSIIMYIFVGTFGDLAPPPPYQKAGYASDNTHTFPLGAPHWRTGGGGGGLGGACSPK